MSELFDSVKKHLPKYRQSRVSFCGAPMPQMLRDDATVIDGAVFRCGDRFCAYCADKKAQRVFACILRAVSGTLQAGSVSSGVMVTLTHQKPEGLSKGDLILARELQSKIQRECHRRLRRHDYAVQRSVAQSARGAYHKSDEWLSVARSILPRFDPSTCYKSNPTPLLDNTFSGLNPASGGMTTYIWSREVTSGGDTRYPGWHAHSHYLVPTESDAHRLISAHIAACKTLGVACNISNQKISFPKRASWRDDSTRPEIADAVNYISHYITKNELPDGNPDIIEAYVHGMLGARVYDAAGAWRPIGIGKKRDENAPKVVSVREIVVCVTSDGEVVDRAMVRGFDDFIAQRTPWWASNSGGPLNEYRTKSGNLIFDLKYIESSINFGLGWCLPENSGQYARETPKIFDYSPEITEFPDLFEGII